MRGVNAVEDRAVAAESISQAAGNAADRGNADACQVVDSSIGEVLFKIFNNLPTINEGLEFRRGAEIFEEAAALRDVLEADNGFEKGIFGTRLLSFCFVSIGLHSCINVIAC